MAARPWRLLCDGPGDAAWNMSVDEALLLCAPGARPLLRLYSWREPSVSLGLRQRPPDWLPRCTALGIPVVRRATGGGAVLHAGDLTYSVVAPADAPELPAGLRGSYEWIRARVVDGLTRAGLAARASRSRPGADRLELCFAGATGYEVELDGEKLVGSAQRRTRRAFLQHGSIRLCDDGALYRALTGTAPAGPKPPPLERAALVSALVASFAAALAGGLEAAELSPAEHSCARVRSAARARSALELPVLALSRTAQFADRHP
ncbi:MAG TPA: lipoate--protein ligase family protein [Myxococcota bacterium]|nr:lipoate--protein ligase family protein [Myxococcota bacterium]